MKKIKFTPAQKKKMNVKLVGGNNCVYFDDQSQAFIQKDITQGNSTKEKIWDEDNKVFVDSNVVSCASNNLGMFMAVETSKEKSNAIGVFLNFMMLGTLFIWLNIFG